MLWWLLLGCPRAPLAVVPAPTTYDVAVAAASADRTVTSVYVLAVERVGDGLLAVRTLKTEGSWDEGAASLTYDSEAPTAGDPWPLSLQHAIASVPATIRFVEGAPVALIEPDAWRLAGESALLRLRLPPHARSSGEALLDPEGLIRDLRRSFPGTPSDAWARDEVIAGLPARRVETCERTVEGPISRWTCAGTIDGPTEGPALLHDATSTTTLVADRRGLVSLESTYSGTVVVRDPADDEVVDRPIVGRRLVVRR